LPDGDRARGLTRETAYRVTAGVLYTPVMALDLTQARSWLMRRASNVHHRLWWGRAMTLGVRGIVLDGEQVFLVRHTYLPGWYLPGGAVDRGESAEAAVIRELREEGGIRCLERPILHGFYHNGRGRDHVACYVVRKFECVPRMPDWEIAESGFFSVGALPSGTSPATLARLAELRQGGLTSADW
jgi:8-oxo-dGTP pyrophosphatase MutT (NUDIX family)